ncbi:hypothetical protein C8R43DRAFT_210286 [Mycena crocata]|nr:hypothetical protein C8R43DRAFT_210286 [Mycena crocata]
MAIFRKFLALHLLLCVSGCAAQAGPLPQCALNCLRTSATKVGCEFSDNTCLHRTSELFASVAEDCSRESHVLWRRKYRRVILLSTFRCPLVVINLLSSRQGETEHQVRVILGFLAVAVAFYIIFNVWFGLSNLPRQSMILYQSDRWFTGCHPSPT